MVLQYHHVYTQFGHALALFAVIFHGSANLYIKGGQVAANRSINAPQSHPFLSNESVSPVVFQAYYLFGVFACSLAPVLYSPSKTIISSWGLLSGLLLTMHTSFGFWSARFIGWPMSSAVISSVAIVASFFLGYLLLDDAVWSSSMCSVALTLMVVGVIGVSWCSEVAQYLRWAEERSPILVPFELEKQWRTASPASKGAGMLLGLVSGVLGASVLFPWVLFETDEQADPNFRFISSPGGSSSHFLPSFGIGAFGSALVLLLGQLAWTSWGNCRYALEQIRPCRSTACGILAGMVWSAGNLFAMFAIQHVGYSMAYPIFHSQVVVIAFYNAYLYNEIRGTSMLVFLTSSLLLVSGMCMLSMVCHS